MQQLEVGFLHDYAEAWNNHDIESLMGSMTEDCIFETAGGDEPWGTRYQGAEQVRERFESVWMEISDAHWSNCKHFISGERGFSEWLFSGSTNEGKEIEVQGCDIFTFREGKIYIKSTFLKNKK